MEGKLFLLALFAQITTADSMAGGPGWVGTGLLGSVLAWLMFVHLPAKDKQIKDMMSAQADERERERESRHKIANMFQVALAQIQNDHTKEFEQNREAFQSRTDNATMNLKAAIELQTVQLRDAIRSSCSFHESQQHHRLLTEEKR